jgi:diketogulonate reductase-like aldo/keto reductase
VARHVADVPIAVNQIEYHPWLQRPELVEYCRQHDVVVEAAAPLARTEVLADETLREIAETYDRSPAQVALRWAIENDVVAIPKSSSGDHIRENIDLFDWELDPADRQRIDALDRDEAVYDDRRPGWDGDVYGISK